MMTPTLPKVSAKTWRKTPVEKTDFWFLDVLRVNRNTHLSYWRSFPRRRLSGSGRVHCARGCRGSGRGPRGCAPCGSGHGASDRGRETSSFFRRGSERD